MERCVSCGKLYVRGQKLEFISKINRDGSGTVPVEGDMKIYDYDIFALSSLSVTQGTYIASEMDSYVVRIKK